MIRAAIILGLLLGIYTVYALGEYALCYNTLRHDSSPITASRDTLTEHCRDVHLFFPFRF